MWFQLAKMRVLGWVGGWKLYAILFAVGLSSGIYAGIRWEKGSATADLEKQLAANQAQYEENLNALNSRWQGKVDLLNGEITSWATQAANDTRRISELMDELSILWGKFDEIENEITTITDFGTCEFSPDAISLLRAAATATTSGSLPDD